VTEQANRRREQMSRVAGKVAFVTGAARGQGRGHALRLAEEGADIIALDIAEPIDFGLDYPLPSAEDLDETVRQAQALGRRAIGVHGDVREPAQLASALERATAKLGRLDIVCANAGIATYASTAGQKLSQRQWQDVVDVNLTGVWNTCNAAIPHLRTGGVIVLTASTLAGRGVPNAAHYVATKHGVLGIMRALAHELGPEMIRVNAVMPGMVPTEMFLNDGTARLFRPDLENPTLGDAEDVFKSLMILPIKWVDVIDVSNAVLFLASDEARHITSVALPVDGGALAK
jgi:(+)-trans-carveol dehydrogenase